MHKPYGLTEDELDAAHGDVAVALEIRCREALKPLTDEQKRAEWHNLFMEQVNKHSKELKIWLDGDNRLWLGWIRKDSQGMPWILMSNCNCETCEANAARRGRKMHKHTEGPWKVHAIFPDEAKGHTFAPVVSVCATEFNSVIRLADIPDVLSKDSEEMANAKLMAASPEMYKALKAFVVAWEQSHQLEKTDVALRLAKAVIDKVDGTERA